MQRQVLFNVQLLRFFAAFAILFTHAVGLLIPNSPIITRVPWVAGVDVFFVISGFIMTWMTREQFGSRSAAENFLKRRIIRVVPPYWFFTLLTVAAVIVAGGRIKNVTADPALVISSLAFIPWPRVDGIMVPILPQGWTLNYEAFFYLAFALCMTMRRGLPILVAAFVVLAASAAFIPERWFVARFFADPIILEFVAGIAVGRLYLSGVRLSPAASAGLIIASAGAYFATPAIEGAFHRLLHLGIPAALLASALILGREPKRLNWLGRAIKAGGDASYTLYLSHKPVVAAVLIGCGMLGVQSDAAVAVIALAAALAFALIFYRFVEAPVLAGLGNKFKVRGSQVAAAVAP
jgi:peptidoglycan/LPS O-acetylase OafA/YrhL